MRWGEEDERERGRRAEGSDCSVRHSQPVTDAHFIENPPLLLSHPQVLARTTHQNYRPHMGMYDLAWQPWASYEGLRSMPMTEAPNTSSVRTSLTRRVDSRGADAVGHDLLDEPSEVAAISR